MVIFGLLVTGGIALFVMTSRNEGIVAGAKDIVVEEVDPAPPIIQRMEKERRLIVTSGGFDPEEITASGNEKIIWQNQTDSPIYIEHYPEDGGNKYLPFALGETPAGDSVSTFFMHKGRYRYHDRYHPERIGFLTIE